MRNHLIGKRARRLLLIFLAYTLVFPVHIFALPQDGAVVSGQAQISQTDAQNMQINQATHKAIIDWQKFGIAQPESVTFLQPSASALALNRVVGLDPSIINGLLSANGRIFLVNPNGILVGATGRINVNSFIASTLNISNDDFLNDHFVFSRSLGQSLAAIVNQGTIQAAEGGNVSLLGSAVRNEGTIIANLGQVNLGAGDQIALNFAGSEEIKFVVDESVKDVVLGPDGQPLPDSVSNTGQIIAEGGEVTLKGKAAAGIVQSVVNNSGMIVANSLVNKNGVIRLEGDAVNVTQNSGTLDVSGQEEGSTGGTVYVLGSKVGLFGYGKIKASGDKGGGKVLVGGDYQGKNPEIQNADMTYVSPDFSIKADAVSDGNGGTVIVWSDEATRYYGSISARGGELGGDGGFVEISGKQYLEMLGDVDTSAPFGQAGVLLLDPRNVDVYATTGNGGVDTGGSFDSGGGTFGTWTPNASPSIVNVQTALGSGSVIVTTNDGTGVDAGNITLMDNIASADNNNLTLQAANDINLNSYDIDFTGSSGNITLIADWGGGVMSEQIILVRLSAIQILPSLWDQESCRFRRAVALVYLVPRSILRSHRLQI